MVDMMTFTARELDRLEWWANPSTYVRHAYVDGPGQGDASLCGRAVLGGDARWEEGSSCSYCKRVIASSQP